jgi:2-dehydropantoate 2-reductase
MQDLKLAVLGLGATGSVVAAALLSRFPDTFLVGRNPDLAKVLTTSGIRVSGAMAYQSHVKNYIDGCAGLADVRPDILFLCTKTFHLPAIVSELKKIHTPGMKIVSAQNGLGPEDFIAAEFGADQVWRMSLNLGAALKTPGAVEAAFFNKPNHLGCLSRSDEALGNQVAGLLTGCGLDTERVDDINRYVWRKMVMKCTMSAVCAVTDLTFREALAFKPTREIADACIAEALAVARSLGYVFEEGYARQAIDYLLKAGDHKDSMCQDIAHRLPTEIDFLGAKVVEYGRANGVPTPHFTTMTNLVKTIEAHYPDG